MMWGKRSSRFGSGHRPTDRHLPKTKKPEAVGTEAEAKKNQERNARDFRYPKQGFVTPIEYTLLYAMLAVPTIYPESVMLEHIKEQDFSEFMLVKPPPDAKQQSALEDADDDDYSTSYAQLSALMNLAAERWPPPKTEEDGAKSVPQQLCRSILQTVVRHAEAHDLEREAEVQELLEPLGRLNEQKANQAGLALVVPMYLGLGASMVTANPVPIWIGYVVAGALSANKTPGDAEQRNMRELNAVGQRMADAEKTSLLDDSEHDG